MGEVNGNTIQMLADAQFAVGSVGDIPIECQKCHKPIEQIEVDKDIFSRRFIISLQCHGETEERLVLYEHVTANDGARRISELLGTKAFPPEAHSEEANGVDLITDPIDTPFSEREPPTSRALATHPLTSEVPIAQQPIDFETDEAGAQTALSALMERARSLGRMRVGPRVEREPPKPPVVERARPRRIER